MLWQHQLCASLILANDVWFLPTRYAYWKKKLIGGGAAGRMLKKSFHMKKEKKNISVLLSWHILISYYYSRSKDGVGNAFLGPHFSIKC